MNRPEYKDMVQWRNLNRPYHYKKYPYTQYKCYHCGNTITTHTGVKGWIIPYTMPCPKCNKTMASRNIFRRKPKDGDIVEWVVPTYHKWLKLPEYYQKLTLSGYLVLETLIK